MNRKWTLFTFTRGDFKTVEQYLNRQAERGWELERAGILARWKRTDRRDLCWCVDLARPRQSREERLSYAALCREAGWELAAMTGQMYLFKSAPGCTPIPVQTDPEWERRNYNRYYIRSTILSVLVLAAYFLFVLGLGSLLGSDPGASLRGVKYLRWNHWAMEGALWSAPFWVLWALWKLADLIRAAVKGRRAEAMGRSPGWVMWTNGVVTLLAGLGTVPFFAGYAMDTLMSGGLIWTLYLLLLFWAAVLLYRALTMEKELFPRERRRHGAAGAVLAVLFAALIVGRAVFPRESWSTAWMDGKREEGLAAYGETRSLPLIHGEDLGLPVDPETHSTYYEKALIPMGLRMELSHVYGGELLESETVCCFREARAEFLTEAMVYIVREHPRYPMELQPVEIPWADEAWYFAGEPEWGGLSCLILRMGTTVARIQMPLDLLAEENLAVIRAELERRQS